jgi:hypothetical protein
MANLTREESLQLYGTERYTGWGKTEAREDAKKKGISAPQSSGASDLSSRSEDELYNSILNSINSLLDEYNRVGAPALTNSEMEIFLNKAIEQVTPYYDKKKAEIEAGIKEGRIQNMEDILMNIRDVETSTNELLARYDISKAQTDEELANKLADITATRDEELALKADDWRQRIEQKKSSQIQSDTLTSGVGRKQIQDLLSRQALEQQAIQRRAGVASTVAQTAAKYDLQKVALARQTAEKERINKIGTPAQREELESKISAELGLPSASRLPSSAEVLRARASRNITTYKPEALTASEEERKRAIESRKLQLQNEELAARESKEKAQRQEINTRIAQQQNRLSFYRT